MYRLAASAVNHPDQLNQLWGVFNHRSLTALWRNGVTVDAVVPRPHAPPVGPFSEFRSIPSEDESFPYPVSHPRFWYYLPKSLWYHRSGDSMAAALKRWVETLEYSPDVFHGCHLYPDGYALSELSERDRIPLTTYAHGTILNEYTSFNRGTQQRIETAIRSSSVVFCSGDAIERSVRAIVPTATTRVVPIGADPANFPTEHQASLRQELDVPAEMTVVLFCGQYSRQKGVADLIEVLRTLRGESLYFVFIGHGGALRDDVQELLDTSDTLHGRTLWKVPPAVVRQWFAVADLFILPSHAEGRPTVIYEAMASQTPVLTTTVGGIPEQVEDGVTGWLLEPGDISGFRSKLTTLPVETLPEMGRAAETRLRRNGWTWDGHARRLRDTHMEMIGQELKTQNI